jgi:two-component system cell cycle response regulator CpdR
MATILLLEDDETLCFTLEQALISAGHQVLAVSSVTDALQALRSFTPDIALLDLMIGASTSIDVANFVGCVSPRTDVVFITGSALFPNGELFQASGNARWVLRKPVRISDLLEIVGYASAA